MMVTEKRLIDANILEERVNQEPTDGMFTHEIIAAIKEQTTVDATEVVHGRWDEIPNKYMSVTTKTGSYSGHATSCSVCHEVNPNAFKTNYCPNCGAKMDGGKGDGK